MLVERFFPICWAESQFHASLTKHTACAASGEGEAGGGDKAASVRSEIAEKFLPFISVVGRASESPPPPPPRAMTATPTTTSAATEAKRNRSSRRSLSLHFPPEKVFRGGKTQLSYEGPFTNDVSITSCFAHLPVSAISCSLS